MQQEKLTEPEVVTYEQDDLVVPLALTSVLDS